MRRRRRRKYTWFPVQGSAGSPDTLEQTWNGTMFSFDVPRDGSVFTEIRDITFDVPGDLANVNTDVDSSLVDFVGSEYILRRIVGKIFVAVNQNTASTAFTAVWCTAGFFIARCDELSATKGPVGSTAGADRNINYGTQHLDNVREPWIWRRSWMLGNPQGQTGTTNSFKFFPSTNAAYGDSFSGAHLDAKTIRRVSNDNRLYFAVSARNAPTPSALTLDSDRALLRVQTEWRLLGALRKAKQTGAF